MKGGIPYLSLIIVFITSVFLVFFSILMTGIALYILKPELQVHVIGEITYEQPKAENILLTFLGSTDKGRKMSDLIAWSVYFDKTEFYLDGEKINAEESSKSVIEKITEVYKLTLETIGIKKVLAEKAGAVQLVRNAEVPVFADYKQWKLKLETKGEIGD